MKLRYFLDKWRTHYPPFQQWAQELSESITSVLMLLGTCSGVLYWHAATPSAAGGIQDNCTILKYEWIFSNCALTEITLAEKQVCLDNSIADMAIYNFIFNSRARKSWWRSWSLRITSSSGVLKTAPHSSSDVQIRGLIIWLGYLDMWINSSTARFITGAFCDWYLRLWDNQCLEDDKFEKIKKNNNITEQINWKKTNKQKKTF